MRILSICLTLLFLIPLFLQIYKFITRYRFYDLHNQFMQECEKIQDRSIRRKSLEWLLEKIQEQIHKPADRKLTDKFENDFYEIWGPHIPEYTSKIVSIKRSKKLKDLGI